MSKAKKILITGANGLLGSRAAMHFSAAHNVHVIVRSMPDVKLEGVSYHLIDLSSAWNPADLPQEIDTVFHCAQSSKFRNFPDDAMDVFSVNIDSTARLLDYAHHIGVKNFVYASSGGIYGTGMEAFKESSPIPPNGELGYYLGSKLCGEVLSQSYAQIMNVVILRFFFMYGEEQQQNMLIPRLVESVRNGTPITLQGRDGIHINPIYVSDAVNALEKTLDLNESSTFNIAGSEVLSLRAIAEVIGDQLGKAPVFDVQDKEPQHMVADIDGMKENLVAPSVSFAEGVARFTG